MEFAKELISSVWDESIELICKNHIETGTFANEEFCPDRERYLKLEEAGVSRLYTARDKGKLVGYNLFFVSFHLHYPKKKLALQDTLFVAKEHRGFGGYKFIRFVDSKLLEEGVSGVIRHVHNRHDYEVVLRRSGYEPLERSFILKGEK